MIYNHKELKQTNLLSFRSKLSQSELESYIQEINNICTEKNIKVKTLITTTFGIEQDKDGNQIFDIEILLPFNKNFIKTTIIEKFAIKEKILITNAIQLHYDGQKVNTLQVINELNNYIISNNLKPITPTYSVSNNPFDQLNGNINMDLFIGINPNIM